MAMMMQMMIVGGTGQCAEFFIITWLTIFFVLLKYSCVGAPFLEEEDADEKRVDSL